MYLQRAMFTITQLPPRIVMPCASPPRKGGWGEVGNGEEGQGASRDTVEEGREGKGVQAAGGM